MSTFARGVVTMVDNDARIVTLENMQTAPDMDWHAYNASAAGRPARRLVAKAILAAGGGQGRTVLEIGAGGGADALEFARHGWMVHAYDSDDTLTARLVENTRMSGHVQFHHGDAAQVETFPEADVVYAAYSLPMLGADLPAVWARLRAALKPGGVVAVDLFGDRDTWAGQDDVATVTQSELASMFEDLVILEQNVRDEDGRSFRDDKKHWHVISTLARRPR